MNVFSLLISRNYALRRIKDAFKENKGLSQADQVQKQFQFANENLDIIKRQVSVYHIEIDVVTNYLLHLSSFTQVIIGKLYSTEKLVIETQSAHK